mmetsp:Transcript_36641/g.35428  ORF Transcript_36641/g.35428 Transcript_36641/m.35428 type:complete len:136 (+) Transcript_36641:1199-1606(+)
MHKTPSALGFGTFLVHEGLSTLKVTHYLIIFTVTSPAAAFSSYICFTLIEIDSFSSQVMFWVGILLLVSAGSFLYVATIHILPEVFCNTDIHRPHTHHHLPEDHVHDEEHYNKVIELITIIFGLSVPLLLMAFMH